MNVNGYKIEPKADLQGADLQGADLQGANLRGADLRWADLQGADLWRAHLRGANLRDANLRDADLRWANLRDANLRDVDLQGADLQGANLQGADLREARYSVLAVLRTHWEGIPDNLITELMKWDAHATPNPSKFMEWKKGGDCPTKIHPRIFLFPEKRELFRQGKPTMTLWELWEALARASNIKI
jgi:hypothetical protein